MVGGGAQAISATRSVVTSGHWSVTTQRVLRSVVFLPVLDMRPQVNGSWANLPLCFLSLSEGPDGSDGPVPVTQMSC